ncbi:hypothetical protein [Prauserella flavalba]|uniref:Uncharacterized protein n=1 Tax=Prauserella flavalba TaxID=1477506 RepID=A0A318LMK6_9PSEU|nr:hypothetical protein [Prauserella flavalba]PXY35802.1 hypothetical protein BA062_09985 [Prauserella flavalba]
MTEIIDDGRPTTDGVGPLAPLRARPLGDRPARDEPLLGPPLLRLRRKARPTLLLYPLLTVPFAAGLVLGDPRAPLALPVLGTAFFGLGSLYNLVLWFTFLGRPAKKLLAQPVREMTATAAGMRVTRLRVTMRVAGAPEEQWLRMGLPAGLRTQLLAEPRLWVVGPDRKGRALVALPGATLLRPARITTVPPRRSRPANPVRQGLSAPCDDPVLCAHVRWVRRWSVLGTVAGAVSAGWLLQSALAAGWVDVTIPALAVVLLLSVVATLLPGLPRLSKAAHALTWTPLPAVLDDDIRFRSVLRMDATGRVWLPDGTQRTLRLRRVSPELVANIRCSRQLWIIGAPGAGGAALAGIPGQPVLDPVILGRRAKTARPR